MRRMVPLIVMALALVPACSSSDGYEGGGASPEAVSLCGGCGHVKGSPTCCNPANADCAGCGMDKGAPGCCKIPKGADAALCGSCGEVGGTTKCCVPNSAVCMDCNKHKGAPGCCLPQIPQ